MSIFQDFNRSIDWVTFQQPRQNITEIMVSPKTLDLRLVTAGRKKDCESMESHPAKICQKSAATDWHRFDLDRAYKQARYGSIIPLALNFVIAQGSTLQTKSANQMFRPHAYFVYGMMCPQVWQGYSCWKQAWLLRTFASFWGVYCSVNFCDGGVCCANCLTALNEMSIFQDFNR